MLERCGGSCYAPPYSCISNQSSLHTVEVMLVQSKWPHGEHDIRLVASPLSPLSS